MGFKNKKTKKQQNNLKKNNVSKLQNKTNIENPVKNKQTKNRHEKTKTNKTNIRKTNNAMYLNTNLICFKNILELAT